MGELRLALQLNAFTCAAFGALFLFFAPIVSGYLGAFPESPLRVIGGLLLFHGAHLLGGSLRARPLPLEVAYFSMGDLLWFLGSLLLLVGTDFITRSHGVIATIAVATLVAGIGLAQLWTLSEVRGTLRDGHGSADHVPQNLSRLASIGYSWMRIKTWVKIWLFALNAAFLAAIFYWPTDFAQVVLASYAATGPLLFAVMIVQRGLTKLLGVAHLIPWIPLAGYVWVRLSGQALGPQLTYESDGGLFVYAIILLAFVAICLAFDVFDLARWLMGDRARIGSPTDMARRTT